MGQERCRVRGKDFHCPARSGPEAMGVHKLARLREKGSTSGAGSDIEADILGGRPASVIRARQGMYRKKACT